MVRSDSPPADVFRALADPTRRAIYERLAGPPRAREGAMRELTVSALHAGLDISQPAVSQHLAALRAAGLVTERREGRHAYYRAAPAGLAPLADWVARYRAFWPARVEKLKAVLKEMDP